MFVTNIAVFVTGFVLLVQQVDANFACACSGGGFLDGHPCTSSCSLCGLGTDLDIGGSLSGIFGLDGACDTECVKNTAPLIIRPQEIPKPPAAPPSLSPIAGPCVCRKAIVKPAVLPKPVCCPPTKIVDVGCNGALGEWEFAGAKHVVSSNDNCHCASSLFGAAVPVVEEVISADCPPIIFDKKFLHSKNLADLVPADPVSIALALQSAQECKSVPSEDKLAFGFRKIPLELPKPVVYKKNIPEEQIFKLNGEIVELKPKKVTCHRTLEEEAHDALLDLIEEDLVEDIIVNPLIKGITLGELGYGPAKLERKMFMDVSSHGAAASTATSSSSSASNACCGCHANFPTGNVEYKTVPKPSEILIAISDAIGTGECESNEVPEEQSIFYNQPQVPGLIGTGCGICSNPYNVIHTSSSSSSSSSSSCCNKKASVLVQKLLG